MKAWLRKRWDKGRMLQKLKAGILVSAAACFMLFIFAPYEIYLSNQNEFWFDAYTMFPFLAKDFVFFLALSLIGFALAYLLGDICYTIALYGYFFGFIACYIQGNFMVKDLPPFDGTQINWDDYSAITMVNVVIWVIIAAVLLVLLLILKRQRFETMIVWASAFLLLILGSTLMVIGVSGGLLEKKQFVRFTKEDQFAMSNDTNFIILLLDAIDEESFWQVWEQHPEYEEAMADFTFYNNAMSGYAYTSHSLSLIISGEWFENKEPYEDYRLRIYRDSPFFNRLKEEGYALNIYDEEQRFEVGTMDGEFSNMTYAKSSVQNARLFNSRLLKMVGVKYAPYFLKPYCWFDPIKFQHQVGRVKDDRLFVWDNKEFYEDIQREEITYADDRRFKLIHLIGAHVPFYYDQYVNEVEDADYYTCIEASMTVTMAYLDKLKEGGVYDNSVIIVLSDHGYNTSGAAVKEAQEENEDISGRQHPILFVKGLNEKHSMQVSGAPISYEDLVAAFEKLMDGHLSDDCFEYKEGDYRERRYLLYKYLGEDHMVEYVQTGYAGNEETMVPTGRVFDAK